MSERFSGFDTSQYPGDPALQTWKTQSPYKFVGYYLKAPRHSNASWSGKRTTLKNMGWGTAVVYVGRQAEGPGAGGTISASVGQTDGGDAIAKCKAEGFPIKTVVFLDVEHMGVVPSTMKDYVLAWFQTVTQSEFVPGMYCHVKNAQELKAVALHGYPADRPQPLFWVAGGAHPFNPATSAPADSGIAFAALWQGKLDTKDTHGNITLDIDIDVSNFADPSGAYVAQIAGAGVVSP